MSVSRRLILLVYRNKNSRTVKRLNALQRRLVRCCITGIPLTRRGVDSADTKRGGASFGPPAEPPESRVSTPVHPG